MRATFTKKYPMWVDAESFIETVAAHCNVEAIPIAEYRRFLFLVEYKFLVKGLKSNLKDFERYSHAILRKTTKSMSMRGKILGRTHR